MPRWEVTLIGKKGHRYGTILCDLERRCLVDLLPERSAEALCDWLKGHPELEIISPAEAELSEYLH